ncbi:MAG: phosphopantothenoylcysteine decarboxylase domain-containing protein [Limisphaerales bacterium]
MRFLVTCGPTYENLDQVRRLTNFSTGKLGIGLANHLAAAGHDVTLLKGYYATSTDACAVSPIEFTTTEDLLVRIREASGAGYDALFHAAAASDFRFGRVFRRGADDRLEQVSSSKFRTSDGNLLAELVPTRKFIGQLRELFPSARIFGWKYEVDGTREEAIERGRKQLQDNRTDYCVVNGAAYGAGYGIVGENDQRTHCHTPAELSQVLLKLAAH